MATATPTPPALITSLSTMREDSNAEATTEEHGQRHLHITTTGKQRLTNHTCCPLCDERALYDNYSRVE